MSILTCDERRRVTLPKELADQGDKFIAIKIRDEIILKPILEDPIKKLQEEGRKLNRLSLKEMKKIALDEAEKEVLQEFNKRLRK